MAKGSYEQLSAIIRQKREFSPVIDANSLIDEVDISDEPQEVRDRELLRYRISIVMNDLGFRSILKGKSLYVDTKQLNDRNAWNLIIEKMSADIKARTDLMEAFRKIRDGETMIENQLCLVPDGVELQLAEEMSMEQIEDYLRSIAI